MFKMTRIILIVTTGILLSLQTAYSQLQINFADASGDAGTQVMVDVTTDNFPDLVLFQYSVNWDSTVMRINTITNITPMLPNYLLGSNFGLPATSIDVVEGQLTTTWDHPSFMPTTLPPGTRLYTIVFDLVGNPGDQSSIVVSDDPKDREAVIGDFSTDVGVVSNMGTVTINGGGGGGNTDLVLRVSEEIAAPGSNACVEVSVENFENIESAQFSMAWNTAVLNYTNVQGFNLPGLDANAFNAANASMGSLIFFWSEPDGNMVTRNDGDVIFEVCFDVVGSIGQMSNVDIVGSPVAIEVFGNGVTYDLSTNNLTLDNGRVTVDNPPADPLSFTVGSVTNAMEGSEQCLPISIANFNDIVSFGYSVTYDPAELEFVRVDNLNLPGLSAGNFNLVNPGQLNVSWSASSGGNETHSDRSIFEVCFNVLAPCSEETNPVRIGKSGITPEVATIIGVNPVAVMGVEYNDGSISCGGDPPDCQLTPIAADCGDNQGDIFVTTNADSDCECAWTGPVNMTSTVGAGCNLIGAPAGTYTLTITCDGVEFCTQTATIDPAPMIEIQGNVTDAGCTTLGSITAVPSGGTAPYTFMWSNGMNTPSINNLQAGDYTVTVTGAAMCSNTRTFTVNGEIMPVSISMFDQSDVLCNGDNTGTASIVVINGCTPYTFAWTGSSSTSAMANDLAAGVASVTVTDNNGVTASMSFTIAQPDPINITAPTINASCPGLMEGNIMLSVVGGVAPFSEQWSDGGNGNNLNPGNYDVTITDANNCTASATFTVPEADPSECSGACPSSIVAASSFNGFGVSCNGASDGSIDVTVSGNADYPITYTLSGPATGNQTLNAAGNFGFDDLPAGQYILTSVNNTGDTCPPDTIVLTEPARFNIASVNIGDATEGNCDGFIDYTLSGGVGTIACFINGDLETDCDFSDLCEGMYVISFEDSNGCSTERMVRVNGPNGPAPSNCYEVTSVVTPNQDGVNDFFDVSCVNDFPTRLQVFDRWGRLVFQQDAYDGFWDGTDSNGAALGESAYMYVLIVDFGSGRQEVFKGTVTILR
jgi:gliding motility-associated-like protein